MVGRAAFRELKIRGYLNPANWYNASNVARIRRRAAAPTYWFNGTNTNHDGPVTPAWRSIRWR